MITRYRAYERLADPDPYRGPWAWNRVRIPIYGSLALSIPAQQIDVPDSTIFQYENGTPVVPVVPETKFARTRALQWYAAKGVPVPDAEAIFSSAPPRLPVRRTGQGPPDEHYRKRQDVKVTRFWALYYQMLSKTYGRFTEWLDFQQVVMQNWGNPLAIMIGLGLNEAVDYSYGYAHRQVKKRLYRSRYWTLPVGFITLSRLWR